MSSAKRLFAAFLNDSMRLRGLILIVCLYLEGIKENFSFFLVNFLAPFCQLISKSSVFKKIIQKHNLLANYEKKILSINFAFAVQE